MIGLVALAGVAAVLAAGIAVAAARGRRHREEVRPSRPPGLVKACDRCGLVQPADHLSCDGCGKDLSGNVPLRGL
jgi:hypothetical protein